MAFKITKQTWIQMKNSTLESNFAQTKDFIQIKQQSAIGGQ